LKVAAVFLCVLFAETIFAQDAATGLGRIYIRPMEGQFEELLAAEIVKERLPAVVTGAFQSADCVIGLEKNNLMLVDRQNRTMVWVFTIRTDHLIAPKGKKLAVRVIRKMKHDGAFCGGTPFNAPSQSSSDRVKDFKPPFFNW
jgi:hypothetical protein